MLVEVHPGVQARRLLERRPVVAARLQGVERARRVGEEPEGVEVRAGDPVALDDLVGARRPEPQRPGRVPDVVRREPVDHRPLVHPEAAEVRRPAGGRGQQPVDLRDDGQPRGQQVGGDTHPGGPLDVPLEPEPVRPVGQRDAVPGVPAAQRGRALGVVGEEEVLDRVAAARAATREVRRRSSASTRASCAA